MTKPGPKRARYDSEDRPYRIRALKLIQQGESAWAAAQAVVDDDMKGIGGSYAKARRLHAWLVGELGKMPLPLALTFETGRALRDALERNLSAKG